MVDRVNLQPIESDDPRHALTDKQLAFVEHYCATGGKSATASARAAGYADAGVASAGAACLHNPKVLKALQWLAERKMTAMAYVATDIMETMMTTGVAPNGASVPPAEIRKLAERAQDFNGILAIRKSQLDINVTDNRKPEEIVQSVYALLDEIGGREAVALRKKVDALMPPQGEVVDVEFEEDFSDMVIE